MVFFFFYITDMFHQWEKFNVYKNLSGSILENYLLFCQTQGQAKAKAKAHVCKRKKWAEYKFMLPKIKCIEINIKMKSIE